MLEKIKAIDSSLFLWLNGHHSPAWDKLMWHISGKIEWVPFYLLLIGYLIYRYKQKSIFLIIAIVLAVTLADQLAVKAFKEVFQRLRPSNDPIIGNLVHVVNNYKGGSFGFVSNHAANTFALASFLCFIFKNTAFRILILIWATIVSYSRIYLGVHYPGDVICGAMLGIICSWLVYIAYQYLVNQKFKKFSLQNISIESK
jgi:undecaprenyl-diphosphatase